MDVSVVHKVAGYRLYVHNYNVFYYSCECNGCYVTLCTNTCICM